MTNKYIATATIKELSDEQLIQSIIRMDQEKVALVKAMEASMKAMNELINTANENLYRLQTERTIRELNNK